jgi:hypothetical protein
MPYLKDYSEFSGLHWETGTVRNFFAYRGFVAPHTSAPFSEALLMGISGGAVMGYFSFAYEGYDPHVALLTRNTFDPWDTLLQRLGVAQTVMQTNAAEKGLFNLVDALESGIPPIVWADIFSLPYNALQLDAGMWAMFPILVFGYDEPAGMVSIADRARVALTTTTAELEAARNRVKKTKYRIVMLDPPNPDKLKSAVQLGIWDSIKLFSEKPPKGSAENFGFKAYRRWADLLTKPGMRLSWAQVFPPGRKMYAGLTTAFDGIAIFGKDGGAERGTFADFLEEAGAILDRPGIAAAASRFRESARAWDELGVALLPDRIPPFKETRELMLSRHAAFLNRGSEALPEIREINARLAELKESVSADFPLGGTELKIFCDELAGRIMSIHDIELDAVMNLRQAVE